MAMQKITLKRGNTWNPVQTVSQNNAPFDCTDYTVKLYLKKELRESADAVVTIDISWSDRPNGQGTFLLTHTQSKVLQVHEYYFEVNIYKTADNSLVKTLNQGILDVVEVLEKDFS